MSDWYDSKECHDLTREFVDKALAAKPAFLPIFAELGYEKTATEMGRGLALMFPGVQSKYDSINPVLAARMIRERIELETLAAGETK